MAITITKETDLASCLNCHAANYDSTRTGFVRPKRDIIKIRIGIHNGMSFNLCVMCGDQMAMHIRTTGKSDKCR